MSEGFSGSNNKYLQRVKEEESEKYIAGAISRGREDESSTSEKKDVSHECKGESEESYQNKGNQSEVESLRRSYRRRRAGISKNFSDGVKGTTLSLPDAEKAANSYTILRQSKSTRNLMGRSSTLVHNHPAPEPIQLNHINNTNTVPVSPLDLPIIHRTKSNPSRTFSKNMVNGGRSFRRMHSKAVDLDEAIVPRLRKSISLTVEDVDKFPRKVLFETENKEKRDDKEDCRPSTSKKEEEKEKIGRTMTIRRVMSSRHVIEEEPLGNVKRRPTLPVSFKIVGLDDARALKAAKSTIEKNKDKASAVTSETAAATAVRSKRNSNIDRMDTAHLSAAAMEKESSKGRGQGIRRTETHVIDMEFNPEEKSALNVLKSAKSLISNKFLKKKEEQMGMVEPLGELTLWSIILHFIVLIFVEHPFKYHKHWRERMYKTGQLKRPDKTHHKKNISMESLPCEEDDLGALSKSKRVDLGGMGKERLRRHKRKTQFGGEEETGNFGIFPETGNSRKRASQTSFDFGSCSSSISQGPIPARPPKGHLPRCDHISRRKNDDDVPKVIVKSKKKSLEIFGDVLAAIGFNNTIKNKFGYINGLSNMDAKELSGFQARLQNFIKKQHKGRIARAIDHFKNPLSSMQRKHRRSQNKARLLNAIDKHKAHRFESTQAMVINRAFLFGQWVFEGLSAPKYSEKPMLFTIIFPFVLIVFFAFMAGEYSLWNKTNAEEGEDLSYTFGPDEFFKWLWGEDAWRMFDDAFLIRWGGRYLPLVTKESWRWAFSLLIHENIAHLGGNVILFLILSWSLESKYGFCRTSMVGFLSGFAGNFLSACTEPPCSIVLGASGCVFGLAAFYIVDLVGRFKTSSFPCLRLIGIFMFMFTFIIAFMSKNQSSNMSHLGGFLLGSGLGLGLVPRFFDERLEAVLPLISLLSLISLLFITPIYVYTHTMVFLECPDFI